jgi:peptidoglycan/LPS O-acetylase OafA/YrhL
MHSRIPALDGLRGIAILLVLLGHSSLCGMYLFPGLDLSHLGTYGVYLFFVLSAYLLDYQIIKGSVWIIVGNHPNNLSAPLGLSKKVIDI